MIERLPKSARSVNQKADARFFATTRPGYITISVRDFVQMTRMEVPERFVPPPASQPPTFVYKP